MYVHLHTNYKISWIAHGDSLNVHEVMLLSIDTSDLDIQLGMFHPQSAVSVRQAIKKTIVSVLTSAYIICTLTYQLQDFMGSTWRH